MIRLLADTNILVYLLTDTIDEDTAALVGDYESQVFVSSVSMMEFVHLVQSGRIKLNKHKGFDAFSFVEKDLGFRIAYTTREHLMQLERLPLVEGHNDPNDRLIIAQAIADRLELVSSDTKFGAYRRHGLQYIKAEHPKITT